MGLLRGVLRSCKLDQLDIGLLGLVKSTVMFDRVDQTNKGIVQELKKMECFQHYEGNVLD